jgi:hypothetical protein
MPIAHNEQDADYNGTVHDGQACVTIEWPVNNGQVGNYCVVAST